MNSLRAWWHRRILGHHQDPRPNDGVAGPRINCYCSTGWRTFYV